MLAPTDQAFRLVPYGSIDRDSFIHIPVGAIRHPRMISTDLFVDRSANDNAWAEDAIGGSLPRDEISQDTGCFALGFLHPRDGTTFVNAGSAAESRRDALIFTGHLQAFIETGEHLIILMHDVNP